MELTERNDAALRTWAEIRPENLEHNYRALRGCAGQCKFLATVKANAYGHGAVPTARLMQDLGADYLAVACLAEARELRQAGITAPILILGPTPAEQADEVVALGVTQAVFEPSMAKALSDAAGAQRTRAKIHLAVDTGMSRIGVLAEEDPEKAAEELAGLCALPHLQPEGIFTHFAVSDMPGEECETFTMQQFTRFLDVTEALRSKGIPLEIRHCANSGAVLNYPCTALDMVRPGIALYGHYPDPSTEGLDGPGLLPVMALKTRVAAIRTLPAGATISYGRTARMDKDGRIAILPIGYADGLHRTLSNQGCVYLNGRNIPRVGRICMDMSMILLPEDMDVHVGDEAEIFGDNIPLEDLADMAGTISYELLCAVAPRVPRIWLDA